MRRSSLESVKLAWKYSIIFPALLTCSFELHAFIGRSTEQNFSHTLRIIDSDTLSIEQLIAAEHSVNILTHKIDSLQSLNLPTTKYRLQLDSISNSLRDKVAFNPTQKFDSLRTGITSRFKRRPRSRKIDSVQLQLQSRQSKINNAQDSIMLQLERRRAALQNKISKRTHLLDSIAARSGISIQKPNIPGVNGLPNTDLPNINGLSQDNLPQLPNASTGSLGDLKLPDNNVSLPQNSLPDLNLNVNNNPLSASGDKIRQQSDKLKSKVQDNDITKEVSGIKGKISNAEGALEKIDNYSKEIKEVKENGLGEADELKKEAEKRAQEELLKQDAMTDLAAANKDVVKSRNILEQYQDMLVSMKDKDKAMDAAKDMMRDQNMADPFINKQQNLKAGIEQLDKLKKKYGTIADSRYLPKRAPNPMKGKPFRERIVPGVSFQVFTGDRTAIDFQPYVAYKLTGRFRPGIGASYRAAFQFKKPFAQYDEVYGYRVFNDFRLYGTFFLHTEGEWLHFSSSAKLRYRFPADKDFGDWQFKCNAGLFRTYTINKRLTGQFQVLYNVADLTRFPQNKNTSMRFGLEYKFMPRKNS